MPATAHRWDISYGEAVAIQNELRKRVAFSPLRRAIGAVAGADVSFDKRNNTIYAAVAVLEFPSLDPLELATVRGEAAFPYIPGLLSFREARASPTF